MSVFVRKPYDEDERKGIAYYVLRAQLDNGDWLVFDDVGRFFFVVDGEDLWEDDDWERVG